MNAWEELEKSVKELELAAERMRKSNEELKKAAMKQQEASKKLKEIRGGIPVSIPIYGIVHAQPKGIN